MRGLGALAVAMLCGPFAATAAGDHAETPPGEPPRVTRAIARALGPDVTVNRAGLFKVPLGDGELLRTHGPDPRDVLTDAVAAAPDDRFVPGAPERAPVCASDLAIQVLYARTASTADGFAAATPRIRSTVRRSNNVLNEDGLSSGGGGAEYRVVCSGGGTIDIQQFLTAGTSFGAVVQAAKLAGYDDRDRNYAIFLDSGGGCGVGSLWGDDSPLATNPNNTDGGYSVVYEGCWEGVAFMHEIGHNRGAVQSPAPNSTGSGHHCNDEYDVMCYVDGGDRNQVMIYPCTTLVLFDCGHDDYFDQAPEPGEYLATHWNLGNPISRFWEFSTRPGAAFAASCRYLVCTLANSSSDADGPIAAHDWAFGDGATSAQANPEHTYAAPGTYEIDLTVTDGNGATAAASRTVTVGSNRQPSARFEATCKALGCVFENSSSDPDGSVESYLWNFDDGATSTRREPEHVFRRAGTYGVALLIADDGGAYASDEVDVHIERAKTKPLRLGKRARTGSAWIAGTADPYKTRVPQGLGQLIVNLSGPRCTSSACPDLDLSVKRKGSVCRSERDGAVERCKISSPDRGRWKVGVQNSGAPRGTPYKIKARAR